MKRLTLNIFCSGFQLALAFLSLDWCDSQALPGLRARPRHSSL
jgi:hypothetical protein